MDRIRNAISRARPASTKRSTTQAPSPTPHMGPSVSPDSYPFFACDRRSLSKHRIISNDQDPVLNAYRVLRTKVLQKTRANGWKTMAVVSPGSGAGKTVTAVNLALSIASKADESPLLVDVDFYRPSVARYLGIEEPPSVLDYFENNADFHSVIGRPDTVPNLMVAPNERVTRRGSEYLGSDRSNELVKTALGESGASLVIFDISPILGCDDTLAFLPYIDCVLVVASSGQTRVGELKEAKRLLGKTNIIGTVLNKTPTMFMPNMYY